MNLSDAEKIWSYIKDPKKYGPFFILALVYFGPNLISLIYKDEVKSTVFSIKDSPGSIATVGQVGNNVINNNLDIPEPKVTYELIFLNTPVTNGYLSKFEIHVDTKVPINNFYIKVNAKDIISVPSVKAQKAGGIQSFNHMGLRDGYAFVYINQVQGDYYLEVTTKTKQDNITLSFEE